MALGAHREAAKGAEDRVKKGAVVGERGVPWARAEGGWLGGELGLKVRRVRGRGEDGHERGLQFARSDVVPRDAAEKGVAAYERGLDEALRGLALEQAADEVAARVVELGASLDRKSVV